MTRATRYLGLILRAASYGSYGAFGSILEATGSPPHAKLAPLREAPGKG